MVIIYVALFAGILFVLQKLLYRKYWQKGVEVAIAFEEETVMAGDTAKLLEIVENRKYLPLPSLKVKFQCSRHLVFQDAQNSAVTDQYYRNDLFSVMPYNRITRRHTVHCPRRGYYTIYGIDLVGADLFFSEEMVGSRDSGTSLYVLPAPLGTQFLKEALKKINGEIAVRRYELEDPFTYRGIREYEPHDEMKTINWKATARTGELKVNMREHTAVKSVRIFLNLSDRSILRREELLELCIRICAMLVKELMAQGIKLAVYANAKDCLSDRILQMEDRGTSAGLQDIGKALARLDLEKETTDFAECFREELFAKQDMYTLFLSPERHDEFQELLCEYREAADFTWICPVKEMEEESIREVLRKNTLMLKYEEEKHA